MPENITPKEKAQQLVDQFLNINGTKMSDYSFIYLPTAKICAGLVAKEAIAEHEYDDSDYASRRYKFWAKVREEIKNI